MPRAKARDRRTDRRPDGHQVNALPLSAKRGKRDNLIYNAHNVEFMDWARREDL